MIPLVCFVGRSGSGKTTLLEKLIPELCRRGIRIAVIKHTHHSGLADTKGSDTYKLAKAGGSVTMLHGLAGITLFAASEDKNPPIYLLEGIRDQIDLVIAEGYKNSDAPKIAVCIEKQTGLTDGANYNQLVGIVTDSEFETEVPVFSSKDVGKLAKWILGFFGFELD